MVDDVDLRRLSWARVPSGRLERSLASSISSARENALASALWPQARHSRSASAKRCGIEDMISIGTIGLIKAVDTFDPARASKFASYASRCIENELRMELRKIRREGAAVSLQEPLESGSGQLTLADTLPDDTVMEDDCERRADAARLRRLVDTLPVRERALLQLRYGLGGERPATQQQTADKLGISRSYVSRLEKRALTRLMNAWRR